MNTMSNTSNILPTMEDMSPDERDECLGMQVDTEERGRARIVDCEPVGGYAELRDQQGRTFYAPHSTITPMARQHGTEIDPGKHVEKMKDRHRAATATKSVSIIERLDAKLTATNNTDVEGPQMQ